MGSLLGNGAPTGHGPHREERGRRVSSERGRGYLLAYRPISLRARRNRRPMSGDDTIARSAAARSAVHCDALLASVTRVLDAKTSSSQMARTMDGVPVCTPSCLEKNL